MGVGARLLAGLGLTAVASALAILSAGMATAEGSNVSVRLPVQGFDDQLAVMTVTVSKGDHLWKIARQHLETVTGEEQSSFQIARYWRGVIEFNIGHLRSGDPDLIYPGEVVVLPDGPISGRP